MFDPKKYSAGTEVDKCRERLAQFCVGDGLDIGCGGSNPDTRFYWENKIVPTAIGVDLARTNLSGSADSLRWFQDNSLDYIFSSHLLEHLVDPSVALAEWFRVLKFRGLLIMYLPLYGYYPSVGDKYANKDHKWNLTPNLVLKWLYEKGLKHSIIKIEEQIEGDEYSFDFVVRKEI